MSAATHDFEHGDRTTRSRHRYLFLAKHHGGDPKAATWLALMSQREEFSIFDSADERQIADERGWLYGVWPDGSGGLREIGTRDEQIAEFQPGANPEEAWHGYPKWTVNDLGPANRKRQQCRPEIAVFDRMVQTGFITKLQRRRLLGGKHA